MQITFLHKKNEKYLVNNQVLKAKKQTLLKETLNNGLWKKESKNLKQATPTFHSDVWEFTSAIPAFWSTF